MTITQITIHVDIPCGYAFVCFRRVEHGESYTIGDGNVYVWEASVKSKDCVLVVRKLAEYNRGALAGAQSVASSPEHSKGT